MEDDVTFFIECPDRDVDELRGVLAPLEVDVQASSRRQLDGVAASSWLVLATVAVQSAPALIEALKGFLTRDNIDVTVNGHDLSITNASPEELDRLLTTMRYRDPDG